MDFFLQSLSWIAVIALLGIGLAGCIIPVLPGHPLILVATLLAQLTLPDFHVAWYHWLALILLCVIGMFGDNIFSVWGAQRFGSTRAGLWGCLAGAFIGIFFFPWGLILGPFIGAVVAELIVSRQKLKASLYSGTGAFLGTIAGFVFKIGIALAMIIYVALLMLL